MDRAIRLHPHPADYLNSLGNVRRALGQLDAAVVSYRQALEHAPEFAGAHYNLANALRDQRKLDEAIVHYRQAIEHQPGLVVAHLQLGHALRMQGMLDPDTRPAARCWFLPAGPPRSKLRGSATKGRPGCERWTTSSPIGT